MEKAAAIGNTFTKLPPELQDMIYHIIFTDDIPNPGRYDVKVGLSSDDQRLICPALDFFADVKALRNTVSAANVQWIKNILFRNQNTRYVFTDTMWPPKYAPQKLSDRFQNDNVQHSIRRIAFPRFTRHGLDLGVPVDVAEINMIGKINSTPTGLPSASAWGFTSTSPYLQYLWDSNTVRSKWAPSRSIPCHPLFVSWVRDIRFDLNAALSQLSILFPNLTDLSIGLDIIDCLPAPITGYPQRDWSQYHAWHVSDAVQIIGARSWGAGGYTEDMVTLLEGLNHHPHINHMGINIQWKSFYRHGRDFGTGGIPDNNQITTLEGDFYNVLRHRLNANGVTHSPSS